MSISPIGTESGERQRRSAQPFCSQLHSTDEETELEGNDCLKTCCGLETEQGQMPSIPTPSIVASERKYFLYPILCGRTRKWAVKNVVNAEKNRLRSQPSDADQTRCQGS